MPDSESKRTVAFRLTEAEDLFPHMCLIPLSLSLSERSLEGEESPNNEKGRRKEAPQERDRSVIRYLARAAVAYAKNSSENGEHDRVLFLVARIRTRGPRPCRAGRTCVRQ